MIDRETRVWLTMAVLVVVAASLSFCTPTKAWAMTKQEKADVRAVIEPLRELLRQMFIADFTTRAKIQAADAAAEDLILRLNNEADTEVNDDRHR